jgi:hypothetical protein
MEQLMIDPQLNLQPNDEHNRSLVENVHPPEWQNPTPNGSYNLVVLGAGTAGLVAAAGSTSAVSHPRQLSVRATQPTTFGQRTASGSKSPARSKWIFRR